MGYFILKCLAANAALSLLAAGIALLAGGPVAALITFAVVASALSLAMLCVLPFMNFKPKPAIIHATPGTVITPAPIFIDRAPVYINPRPWAGPSFYNRPYRPSSFFLPTPPPVVHRHPPRHGQGHHVHFHSPVVTSTPIRHSPPSNNHQHGHGHQHNHGHGHSGRR
jgi:hypothetical protein